MQMFCLAFSPVPLKNKPPPNPNEASFTYGKHKAETKSPRGVTQRRNPTLPFTGGESSPNAHPLSGGRGVLCGENRAAALLLFFLLRTLRDRASGYPLRGRWASVGGRRRSLLTKALGSRPHRTVGPRDRHGRRLHDNKFRKIWASFSHTPKHLHTYLKIKD